MAARLLEPGHFAATIDQAIGRWQVLAVTGKVLESIRASYQNRSSARNPSGGLTADFSQMTQGRYRRVLDPGGGRGAPRRGPRGAPIGQLYIESTALALGKVYSFGPTFRAEKSKTRRHLTEFWMIEPELPSCDLDGLLELAENFLSHIVQSVFEESRCPSWL